MTEETSRLQAQKRALRQTVLANRDALPPEVRRSQSDACIAQLLARPEFVRARTVLLTMSMGSEIDTAPIIAALHRRGTRVVLPRVVKGQATLALHCYAPTDTLVPSTWGILEPAESAPRAHVSELDLIVVPGVAFDRRGNRLGYGRGYFDRLLAADDLRTDCEKIALALDCQMVDAVPVTAHDMLVPLIITPSGIFANVRQTDRR